LLREQNPNGNWPVFVGDDHDGSWLTSLVAADATCARLMGFDPLRIMHISEGSLFLGNAEPAHIDQVGGTIRPQTTPFRVVPEFENLYAI
jgi:hypothetical protein